MIYSNHSLLDNLVEVIFLDRLFALNHNAILAYPKYATLLFFDTINLLFPHFKECKTQNKQK